MEEEPPAWEMQKENAAPRKEGRRPESLQMLEEISRTGKKAHQQYASATKAELWKDIEQYSGSDPLKPWYRLIKWIEENEPILGAGSSYVDTLERCARQFKDDERYKDDPRYLRVWIKLIDSVSDPSHAFDFMEAREIGRSLALFYEAKAVFLELRGAYQQARETLEAGILRKASPPERLKRRRSEFCNRMQRRAAREAAEGAPHGQVEKLREFGRDRDDYLTSDISGTSFQQSQSQYGHSRALNSDNNNGGTLAVFTDENDGEDGGAGEGARHWTEMPTLKSMSQENSRPVSRDWQKAALRGKTSRSTQNQTHTHHVEVLPDEQDQDEADTTSKERETNLGFASTDGIKSAVDEHEDKNEESQAGEHDGGEEGEKDLTVCTRQAFEDVMAMFGTTDNETAARGDDATVYTRDAMKDVFNMLTKEDDGGANEEGNGQSASKQVVQQGTSQDNGAFSSSDHAKPGNAGSSNASIADGGGLEVFEDCDD